MLNYRNVLTVLALVSLTGAAQAQTQVDQAAYEQAIRQMQQQQLQQAPMLQGMQELNDRYQRIRQDRQAQRSATVDAITAEELAKARQQQAAGQIPDALSAADMATNTRLEALRAQWREEDMALEQQMQQEMMESTGMGDMLRMQ